MIYLMIAALLILASVWTLTPLWTRQTIKAWRYLLGIVLTVSWACLLIYVASQWKVME